MVSFMEFEYKIEDGYAVITGFKGDAECLRIPRQVDGVDVKAIGNGVFTLSKIKSLVIEEGIEKIGQSAFAKSSSLTKVSFPESLKIIDNSAFEGCGAIKSLKIGKNVEEIGDKAFSWCSAVEELIFEPCRSLKIGFNSFAFCW